MIVSRGWCAAIDERRANGSVRANEYVMGFCGGAGGAGGRANERGQSAVVSGPDSRSGYHHHRGGSQRGGGKALSYLVRFLDPDIIIIGGGSQSGGERAGACPNDDVPADSAD